MNAEWDLQQELRNAVIRHARNGPPNLREAILYSVLAPGKRIRPRLTLAAGDLLSLEREKLLPCAIAIELMHCFSLIHDDLPGLDNDDFRRGQPSNHKKFGEGLAILAGDALLVLSLSHFMESRNFFRPEHVLEAYSQFLGAAGPSGLVGGQSAEMLITKKATLQEVLSMHLGKTGELFRISLVLPATLQGIQPDSEKAIALSRYGEAYGRAFQICDDIEDFDGDKPREQISILRYLSRADAANWAKQLIQEAQARIDQLFGPAKGNALRPFSDEQILNINQSLKKS